MSSSPPLGLHQKILYSPPHCLDQHQKQKDRTLNSPSILISFRNTGNKVMNSSTGCVGLLCVADNHVAANEG